MSCLRRSRSQASSANRVSEHVKVLGVLWLVYGAFVVLGAIGMILPGLTGIRPGLTPLGAAGLVIIMIGATVINIRKQLSRTTAPRPPPAARTGPPAPPGAGPPVPVRIGYRSFDRQWVLPDARLMDMPRRDLWAARIPGQVFTIEQYS